MPWEKRNPDLSNDPSYLEPRLNDLDAQLADVVNVKATKTTQAITYYIDPINGNDNNTGLLANSALKTIQRAIDIMPQIILHRVTVQLADGIHNEGSKFTNPYEDSSTPRECRVLIDDKTILARDLLVIKGNTLTPSNVVIDCGTLPRGVYAQSASGVIIEGVEIKTRGSSISVFAHRNTTLRIKNTNILGDNTSAGSKGVTGESKCLIEFDGDIRIEGHENAITCLDAYVGVIGNSMTISTSVDNANSVGVKVSNGSRFNFWGGTLTIDVKRYAVEVYSNSYCNISPSVKADLKTPSYIVWAYKNAHFEAFRTVLDGGSRGIFAHDSYVSLSTSCMFKNQTSYNIEATKCTLNLNDVDFYHGINNLNLTDCNVTMAGDCYLSSPTGDNLVLVGTRLKIDSTRFLVTAAKRGIFAKSSTIFTNGGLDVDGGYQSIRLEQSSVYEGKGAVFKNATGHGIYAIRGSQAYYQSSTTTFTGAANCCE